jgi:hypothetical protein
MAGLTAALFGAPLFLALLVGVVAIIGSPLGLLLFVRTRLFDVVMAFCDTTEEWTASVLYSLFKWLTKLR